MLKKETKEGTDKVITVSKSGAGFVLSPPGEPVITYKSFSAAWEDATKMGEKDEIRVVDKTGFTDNKGHVSYEAEDKRDKKCPHCGATHIEDGICQNCKRKIGKGSKNETIKGVFQKILKYKEELVEAGDVPPYVLQVHNAYLAAKEKGDTATADRLKKQLDQYVRQYKLDPNVFREGVTERRGDMYQKQEGKFVTFIPEELDSNESDIEVHYIIHPEEKQTRDYPGAPSSVEILDILLAGVSVKEKLDANEDFMLDLERQAVDNAEASSEDWEDEGDRRRDQRKDDRLDFSIDEKAYVGQRVSLGKGIEGIVVPYYRYKEEIKQQIDRFDPSIHVAVKDGEGNIHVKERKSLTPLDEDATDRALKKGLGHWVADYQKQKAMGNDKGAAETKKNIDHEISKEQLDAKRVYAHKDGNDSKYEEKKQYAGEFVETYPGSSDSMKVSYLTIPVGEAMKFLITGLVVDGYKVSPSNLEKDVEGAIVDLAKVNYEKTFVEEKRVPWEDRLESYLDARKIYTDTQSIDVIGDAILASDVEEEDVDEKCRDKKMHKKKGYEKKKPVKEGFMRMCMGFVTDGVEVNGADDRGDITLVSSFGRFRGSGKRDRVILRQLTGGSSFPEADYDKVLALVSKHGFSLATMKDEKKGYEKKKGYEEKKLT